jgi:hypothetical protein
VAEAGRHGAAATPRAGWGSAPPRPSSPLRGLLRCAPPRWVTTAPPERRETEWLLRNQNIPPHGRET